MDDDTTNFIPLTMDDFRLWSTNALKTYLRVRKKKNSGTFDELVARAYAAYEQGIEVDPTLEHEDRKRLEEYTSRLSISGEVIEDPLEIVSCKWLKEEEGIVSWPSLYYHDIAKYLDHLAPDFLCKLEYEYKLGKAYRYFSCNLVRSISYLEHSNELCVLKCKVVSSHCINNKPYDVWAVIRRDSDEKPGGEILSAYCTCVAGLQGSCNHVIGMLFRVEAAVANGVTRPSKTSVSCQWNIPSGNKLVLTATKAEQLYFNK